MKIQRNRLHGLSPTVIDLLLILGIAGLTYLPLLPQLGYYHDDWFPLISSVSGVSLFNMHSVDRPMMGLVYTATQYLLGNHPWLWHLFAFFLRLAGTYAVFWLARMIWPRARAETAIVSILFLVYPGFLLQPNANNYSNHLISLLLGVLSLCLMVNAGTVKKRWVRGLLVLLTGLLILGYPNIYEAMIGLEALRFIILYFFEKRKQYPGRLAVAKKTFLAYLPYLVPLVLFLVYRLVVFKGARTATDAGLLFTRYRVAPLQMLAQVLFEWGKDILETVLFAWIVPLNNLMEIASNMDILAAFSLSLLAVVMGWFYIRRGSSNNVEGDLAFRNESISIGLAAVLLTLIPVALVDRDVRFTFNLNRYTLQSIIGVSILGSGLLFRLLQNKVRYVAAGLLLFLSVGTQYLNAVYYRDFWDIQRNFWWQLTWRAPDLVDGTVLIPHFPDGYRLAEGYEAWAPANLIYRPDDTSLSITGEVLNNETILKILQRETMGRSMRKLEYTNDYKNSLILSIPDRNSCVHVINGRQPELSSNEDPFVRLSVDASDPKWIDPNGIGRTPPADIFGKEPYHGWCYYYQKADLARQRGDWETVLTLWDEAAEKKLPPLNTAELMPFYEGYVHLRFEKVNEIAQVVRQDTDFIRSYCSINGDKYTLGDTEETLEEFVVKNLCLKQ